MKHLLNDLSEEVKNSIREQHTGGKKIIIENFNKLINSKLGDSKPLVEQVDFDPIPVEQEAFFDVYRDTTLREKLGRVAMGVEQGPKTMGADNYKLSATDKSEFDELKDGKYLYKLGYLTTEGGKYILKYIPKKPKN